MYPGVCALFRFVSLTFSEFLGLCVHVFLHFFGVFLAIFSSRIFLLCSVSSHTRRQCFTCYTDKCPMALGYSFLLFSHYFLFVVQFNICFDLSLW